MLKQNLENWLFKWRMMRCCRLADKQLKKLLRSKQNVK
jgi:hypothetical protein